MAHATRLTSPKCCTRPLPAIHPAPVCLCCVPGPVHTQPLEQYNLGPLKLTGFKVRRLHSAQFSGVECTHNRQAHTGHVIRTEPVCVCVQSDSMPFSSSSYSQFPVSLFP